MIEKKVVIPAAFTQQGRDKNAEKLKAKYEKAGWTIKEHISGGMTKPSYLIVQKESVGKEKTPSSLGWQQWVTLGILVLALVAYTLGGEDTPNAKSSPPSHQLNVDLSQAKTYTVIGKDDFSFSTRSRLSWFITSPANTAEERAQTAMKAAMDLQSITGADLASAWIEIEPALAKQGNALAIAYYAPDNGGFSGDQNWTWQVNASNDQVTDLQILIAKSWEQNKEKFRGQDGMIDEENLTTMLSDAIGVPPSEIHPLWISRSEYKVEK